MTSASSCCSRVDGPDFPATSPDLPASRNWRFQFPTDCSDTVARLVAQKLGERLGQQLVVENRVGGGGSIGTDQVARAEPDVYTLGLANTSTHAVAASAATISYDPVKDFAPISLTHSTANILVVHPSVGATNVTELVALARAKPGTLTFASAGNGSSSHLSGEMFKSIAGIDLTHVPYKGTGPAIIDLLGGHIPMAFAPVPATHENAKTGMLRMLAVTSAVRSTLLPEVLRLRRAVGG